jgi:hypothetical protein
LFVVCCSAGCYGSSWNHAEVPPPATPTHEGARWSQYCTYHGATDLAETNAWLQHLGEQGWELAGVGGQFASVYCFRSRVADSQTAALTPR